MTTETPETITTMTGLVYTVVNDPSMSTAAEFRTYTRGYDA